MFVGIDTGGTFTDLIGYDPGAESIELAKVPSTPHAPAEAVTAAVAELGAAVSQIERVVVGSTIAINAILQRRGADVCYLTTEGFEDIPYIQRINRRHLYDLQWQKGEPLVRRMHTIGVRERVDHHGAVLEPLEATEIERVVALVREQVRVLPRPAVAVCLLFSYVNPAHEEALGRALAERLPDVPVSLSCRVAPIWREYERGSTTIADAYVKPIMVGFAGALTERLRAAGVHAPVSLMKSNGGQIPAHVAADHCAELVLSGLAGGLLAGKYYADLLGRPDVVTLDMGGTSADVGIVNDGEISYQESYDISWAIPIVGSFVDMTSIGAGGSSIAGFDRGGFLKVGPESAAADPGPASYGRGGREPTVTDANVVLGRLDPDYFLGGKMPLHPELARAAVGQVATRMGTDLEHAALAVVRMANENMANAVRVLTVDRGLDHRGFDLLAFGGAGPLHGAEMAAALGMRRVLVPVHPGLGSAFALMMANPRVDRRWTRALSSDTATTADLSEPFALLVREALEELRREGYEGEVAITRVARMRYLGQNYEQEIAVPDGEISDGTLELLVDRFHRQHEAFYGYAMRDASCELAQFNVTVHGLVRPPVLPELPPGDARPATVRPVHFADEGWLETPIYFRTELGAGAVVAGPAVVQELDSTTLVHPGQQLTVDRHAVLFLDLVPAAETSAVHAEAWT
jgi:N-methylhydantoinase A